MSASNTPSYKLAKFLVPILKSLTSNKYTVKHSSPLKIVEQYSEFTIESGKENKMSFLDVQSIREDKPFTTSVYGKSTFSGVYTYFDSFLPSTYKFGTVYTLAYRCFRICSSWTKLHNELVCLKKTFVKNGYPEDFINALRNLWITYIL